MKRRITAQMVFWLMKEPFMVWCELFAPRDEREPFSAFTKGLMKEGLAFQQLYTESLGKAEQLPYALDDLDAGFEKTKELMKQGAAIIANMPLVDAGHDLQGIADVLLKKTTHKSNFGKYHYVVQEVKSGKDLKEEYCLQAAFYHLMLSRFQGYTPLHFFVVTKGDAGPVVHKVAFDEYEQKIKRKIIEVQKIMDGQLVPPPNLKNCDEPWIAYCRKKAKEADDISLVANVGSDKQLFLRKAGIVTVEQLANQLGEVEGIAETKMEQLRRCAQAFRTGESSLLQEPRLPSADTELFIDFEGVDIEGVKREYLLGVLERSKGKSEFHSFVAETPKDEGKMIKEALAFLAKFPDAPVFHYGSYEKTALKTLGQRYRRDVTPVLHRMTDLLQACKRCVAPSSSTFSLKDFGKTIGAGWREGMNAAESMVLYDQYQKTKDKALLQKIVDYNEDDVRATVRVKDWLVEKGSA